ncbi:MAG: DNA-formamidopyrimidine glycosylase family protein [Armatimonadota bacterium]
MPELPDVERFRQYLYSTSLHQTITEVDPRDEMVLADVTEADLQSALVGKKLVDTRRHGKWLFADTDGGPWLCLHFGMTGHLVYFEEISDDPEYDRLLLSFASGMHLAYDCQRRLGRISLTDGVEDFIERRGLGPDARGLSRERFEEAVEGRSARLKTLLMDQSVIAGLGNILVDEILYQAGHHPEQHADELDEEALTGLHGAIDEVVETMVGARTGSDETIPDDWLIHHRDEGAKCPRCGGMVERIKINGRTTYFCPSCQKLQ